jgi:hypothetical protein
MLDEILRPAIDHFQWANNPSGYDKIHVLERVKVSQKCNKQSTWKILPLVSSTNLFVLEQLECKHKWTFCSSNICEMKDDYKKWGSYKTFNKYNPSLRSLESSLFKLAVAKVICLNIEPNGFNQAQSCGIF